MALDPNAKLLGEIEQLLVGQPELLGQLVDSRVLGQRGSLDLSFVRRMLRARASTPRPGSALVSRSRPRLQKVGSQLVETSRRYRAGRSQCPVQGTRAHSVVKTGGRSGTEPRTPARECTADGGTSV